MIFNIKLTNYIDAETATISIYDDIVGKESIPNDDAKSKHHLTAGYKINSDYEIEPFTNTRVYNTIPDALDEFQKQQLSIQKSVARSKRMIQSLMRSVKWEYFITLTFDSAKTDRTDYSLCCKRARVWLQNQRRRDGTDKLKFICIPELHKDMESWHLHAVISNVGDIQMIDSGKHTFDGKVIFNLSGWKWGFSTAIPIDNSDPISSIRLSKYVTKYMTKESFMVARCRHRYFASKNIPRPKTEKYIYESADDMNKIVASILLEHNLEVVYTSHFESTYTNIDYLETITIDSS